MRVILSCGGTGGHIYPAIAIADKIKEKYKDAVILFIGTKKGMENQLVPNAGYEIKGINASGFNRKNLIKNFKTLQDTIEGSRQAAKIISDFKPDFVIGTGAYVTGYVLLQAHRAKIPCYIHEQNAVPGMTNKLLGQFVDKVFISFKGTENVFSHPNKVTYTGNPVRSDFVKLDRASCREELGLKDDEKMILVTGGSLGAEKLNEETIKLFDKIEGSNIKLFFVTGKRYYDEISKLITKPLENVDLIDYANNMPSLMTAADLIISRAGAIAVSEIMAAGKPSILVPSPNVTNNHQFFNAKAIADEKAAMLIEEKTLDTDKSVLADEILRLVADEKALEEMATNAKKLSTIDAADRIVCGIINQ